MNSSYDKTYSTTKNVFGINPKTILTDYINKKDISKPVLDIGIGQGRNTIYLAKNEFRIDGIDTSKVAIENIVSLAKKVNIQIDAFQKSFIDFKPKEIPYSTICDDTGNYRTFLELNGNT